MAGFYVLAGTYHFINPIFYKKIMPPWLPVHYFLIYFTGVCEIIFGLLLLFRQTRKTAAASIIVLLILIFPANIQMMLNFRDQHDPNLWLAILRLPLQVVLIGWAYMFVRSGGS